MTILLKKKIKSWALTLALGGSLMAGVPALERATAPIELSSIAAAGQMSLSVFDVGQGDSILAQEGDKQILIDGGPDSTVLERLGMRCRRRPGDRSCYSHASAFRPRERPGAGFVALQG